MRTSSSAREVFDVANQGTKGSPPKHIDYIKFGLIDSACIVTAVNKTSAEPPHLSCGETGEFIFVRCLQGFYETILFATPS